MALRHSSLVWSGTSARRLRKLGLGSSESYKLHAVAYSALDKETLKARLRDGVVMPRVPADILGEPLSESEVERCDSIVAMMGSEPLIKLLSDGADVVIAGRASDCSVIASLPIMKGFDHGLALHMGDIMECGENALIDVDDVTHRAGPNRTGIVGEIGRDSFVIRSGHPGMACTVESALGHSMHERETHSTVELSGGAAVHRGVEGREPDRIGSRVTGETGRP